MMWCKGVMGATITHADTNTQDSCFYMREEGERGDPEGCHIYLFVFVIHLQPIFRPPAEGNVLLLDKACFPVFHHNRACMYLVRLGAG